MNCRTPIEVKQEIEEIFFDAFDALPGEVRAFLETGGGDILALLQGVEATFGSLDWCKEELIELLEEYKDVYIQWQKQATLGI